jgi:hypothetical protein
MENNLDNAKKFLVDNNFEVFSEGFKNVVGKTMRDYAEIISKSQEEKKYKWIEIKTKEDLPNESNDVEFFVVINGVVTTRVFYNGKFVNDYQLDIEEYDDLPTQPTHYQKIVMPIFLQSYSKAE